MTNLIASLIHAASMINVSMTNVMWAIAIVVIIIALKQAWNTWCTLSGG